MNSHMDQPEQAMDVWFASDAWADIVVDADRGCEDSLELMEEVNGQLNSLIFHLKNNPDSIRIMYEMKYFAKLCDEFDVA